MNYQTATLHNGLRVIHLPSASPVVYCGIGVGVGTRHEEAGEWGLAHFCEHVTFKGTERRSALQVLNCLESVGGDLNAFTNKEDTTFYAAIQREHFPRAVDLLADIVFRSTYPDAEVAHETAVVCDEIESYNDSPAELIYDEFENMLFRGHPLGHNILGTRDSVLHFTASDARRFTRRHYRPERAAFFVYGDVDFDRLLKRLTLLTPVSSAPTAVLPAEEATATPAPTADGAAEDGVPSASVSRAEGGNYHQAHVMLGCRTFGFDDARRMPLYVLNNLLGGPGMNARLNLSLRERHGLVYTVESAMATYSDTGCWSVYFGCDHADVKRCLRLVRRELDRLMQHPLSDRQLLQAKRQLKGQLTIACDNREQFALDFGRHFLHYGRGRSIDDLLQQIDAVTAPALQDVACQFFAPDRLQLLML